MTESEQLWNVEELVSQMELIQKENDNLLEENNKLKTQNRTLSSEKLELQSAVRELTRELQIKSEKIVRQSKSDLIEKENEKLKERDRQRENELSEIRRKSEEEITAVKEDYEEKNNDLIRQKEKYKSSKAELDIKIREQDDIIVRGATSMFNKYKVTLEKEHKARIKKSDAKYRAMIAAIQSELWSTVLYAVVITLFMAAKSECFTENLTDFFIGIAKVIKSLATSAFSAGMWCARAANEVEVYVMQQILHYMIIVIIMTLICGVPGLIIYFAGRKYIKWYKEEIADHISMWVAVIVLAITIFFAEDISSILSINLIWLNIIVHLIYSAGRAYVRGCKRNRGYY